MHIDRYMDRRKVIQLLLVLGLLLGQLAQTVHASDFLAHADNEFCDICLLASGLDHALPADAVSEWQASPAESLPVTYDPFEKHTPFDLYLSRAPPRTTLIHQIV